MKNKFLFLVGTILILFVFRGYKYLTVCNNILNIPTKYCACNFTGTKAARVIQTKNGFYVSVHTQSGWLFNSKDTYTQTPIGQLYTLKKAIEIANQEINK